MFRSRRIRIVIAVALIAVSFYALSPYLVYRVAPSAFVNASLTRVTAPISGRLTENLPKKGEFLAEAKSLPLIDARSPDRTHLLDLQRQRIMAKRNGELAHRQLTEIEQLDDMLSGRVSSYSETTVRHIERKIAETEAAKAGCEAELHQHRDVSERLAKLSASGLTSEIRHATALAQQEETATRCVVAAAALQRLDVELQAVKKGVYLGDGFNDVPYSQQQLDNLILRRQQLETQIFSEELRTSELDAAIEAEQVRVKSSTSYSLPLPSGHVVWSTEASPGTAVTEGQTILHLADCSARFLAVELRERDFEQIDTGDRAYVRLIGHETWHEGWVQNVLGSAARTEDRLLAAELPDAGAGKIAVELRLAPDAFPATGSTYCGIGRLAEVRFNRKDLNILDKLKSAVNDIAEFFGGKKVAAVSADGRDAAR
jgi:multidrug resistance efflux pump